MDADTTLDQGFLTAAVRRFTDDRALMAVGGLFYGEEGVGMIGQFQRNEYTRYARQDQPSSRPGVRADWYGVDLPAASTAHGGRRTWAIAARRPR